MITWGSCNGQASTCSALGGRSYRVCHPGEDDDQGYDGDENEEEMVMVTLVVR